MKKCLPFILLLVLTFLTACSPPSALSDQSENYAVTEVYTFSFSDSENNTMVYYICNTTYYADTPSFVTGLHTDAISAVFDIENTPLIREFDISGHPAAICQGESTNYICCTSSPTASVVMEYDPDSLSEENAIKTIQSIFEPMEP